MPPFVMHALSMTGCRILMGSDVPRIPDLWTAPGPPFGTRFVCPLGDWFFDEERETADLWGTAIQVRHAQTEAIILSHLEKHSLEEWVAAAAELQRLRLAASGIADGP